MLFAGILLALAALVVVAFLTSCAGAGSSAVPPAARFGTNAASTSAPATTAPVIFNISIPASSPTPRG
jgi:hypothetical protein